MDGGLVMPMTPFRGGVLHEGPGVRLLRWHSGLLDTVVRLGDGALCAMLVLLAAQVLPLSRLLPHPASAAGAAVVVALAWVLLLRAGSAYRLPRYRRWRLLAGDAASALIPLAAALHLAAWTIADATPAEHASILAWAAGLLALTLLARLGLRAVVRRGLATGALCRQVAIIGATDIAEGVIASLTGPDEPEPASIIGVFDDRRGTRVAPNILGHALTGTVGDLCDIARDRRVDLIVICLPWSRAMQIFSTMGEVQWIAADILVPLDRDAFDLRSARVRAVAGAPALEVMRQPLQNGAILLKMLEDYLLGALALVVLAPVMVLSALAIRLDSPGPVLFRQMREGFNGREFTILKFRTMTAAEHDPTVGLERGNPYITRVGRILRRFSIDELPQLFNVMRGEMSLVGPRPYVPGMRVGADAFKRAVRDYAVRYRMKPGLTGLSQVGGARGRMESLEKARHGIELDVRYVETWSLWLDLKIMVRTVWVCLTARGAH